MHVPGGVAKAGEAAIPIVEADIVHPALDRISAHVLGHVLDVRVRWHAAGEDEFVLVGRPVAAYLGDPSAIDDELEYVPALALDAVIHPLPLRPHCFAA